MIPIRDFPPTQAILFSALAMLAAVAVPAVAGEAPPDWNYGPGILHLRSQAPAHSFRTIMPHVLPGAIRPGYSTLAASTLSNVWINDPMVKLDYEMLDLQIGVQYGTSGGAGGMVFLDRRAYFGGILDNLIQNFHRLIGIGQNGRDQVGRNQTHIARYDTAGNLLYETGNLAQMDNTGLTFMGEYILAQGDETWPAVDVSGGLRYALVMQGGGMGNDRVDWNLGLGFNKRLARGLYASLHLDYTLFGQTDLIGIRFAKDTTSILAAGVWEISPSASLVLQYYYDGAAVDGLGSLSQASQEANLGLKWKTAGSGTWEVALIENIFFFGNGPDFGFHLAYVKDF